MTVVSDLYIVGNYHVTLMSVSVRVNVVLRSLCDSVYVGSFGFLFQFNICVLYLLGIT